MYPIEFSRSSLYIRPERFNPILEMLKRPLPFIGVIDTDNVHIKFVHHALIVATTVAIIVYSLLAHKDMLTRKCPVGRTIYSSG